MTEWNMHTMENGRKITPWKMTENTPLENDELKMPAMEYGRKISPQKMKEIFSPENDRMENAHHGK